MKLSGLKLTLPVSHFYRWWKARRKAKADRLLTERLAFRRSELEREQKRRGTWIEESGRGD